MDFHALNLYCQGRNGFIIVHFHVVNYTTPIFAGIILENASNFKIFLAKFMAGTGFEDVDVPHSFILSN